MRGQYFDMSDIRRERELAHKLRVRRYAEWCAAQRGIAAAFPDVYIAPKYCRRAFRREIMEWLSRMRIQR